MTGHRQRDVHVLQSPELHMHSVHDQSCSLVASLNLTRSLSRRKVQTLAPMSLAHSCESFPSSTLSPHLNCVSTCGLEVCCICVVFRRAFPARPEVA